MSKVDNSREGHSFLRRSVSTGLKTAYKTAAATRQKIRTIMENITSDERNILHMPMRAVKSYAMENGLISPINIDAVQFLSDDPIEGKNTIHSLLGSLSANNSDSFYDQIEDAVGQCFKREIKVEIVEAFFSSSEIVNFMLRQLIRPIKASNSILDPISRITRDLIEKVHLEQDDSNIKVPLSREQIDFTENDLHQQLSDFEKDYDPKDPEKSMSIFLEHLRQKYPHFNIDHWFEKNMYRFGNLVKKNVHNAIFHHYREQAKKGPHQVRNFIKLYSSRFIVNYKGKSESAEINWLGIKDFFHKHIKTLDSDSNSQQELQEICLEVILCELEKNNLVTDEVREELIDLILHSLTIEAPHLNDNDILVRPKRIPVWMKDKFKELYSAVDDGSTILNNDRYKHIMVHSLGTVIDQNDISLIEAKIQEAFMGVDVFLERMLANNSVPYKLHEQIKNCNSYPELIRIAVTHDDKMIRFAARRKLELGIRYYRLKYDRYIANAEHDQSQAEERLKKVNGIEIIDDNPLKVYYLDEPNIVRLVNEEEIPDLEKLGHKIYISEFLRLKVQERECLCPKFKNSRLLGIKGLESALLKKILKTEERITDLLRTTFIIDNRKINSRDDYDYVDGVLNVVASNGAVTEIKDRANGNSHHKTNGHSANGYVDKTYKLTDGVPITDADAHMNGRDSVYTVGPEVKLMDLESFIFCNSKNHPLSHDDYKRRQEEKAIIEKLFPPEIYGPMMYECPPNSTGYVLWTPKYVLKKTRRHGL